MTKSSWGTAALGDAVLATKTALFLALTCRRTRSNLYWSKRALKLDTCARSERVKARAPSVLVAPLAILMLDPDNPVELLKVLVNCLVVNLDPGIGREGGLRK